MRYIKSAFNHGLTEEDIEQVLATDATVWTTMTPSPDGHERAMVIGFDSQGRLLEVGIELTDDGYVVFHANKATAASQRLFEEEI